MSHAVTLLTLRFLLVASLLGTTAPGRRIEIPLGNSGGLAVTEVVRVLAKASGVSVDPPAAQLVLPTQGISGSLTRTLLAECLGPEVGVVFEAGTLVIEVDEHALGADRRAEWRQRLNDLATRIEEASRRRQSQGMRALRSYRPNDPARPTVCLVHGLNSSSGGFVHMIPFLEQAGYGVVIYDYPFNRSLTESCGHFAKDYVAFRAEVGETRAWAIVAHSMGALLARSYIEDERRTAPGVSSLIMIAPVNAGAHIAKLQTVHQLLSGLSAINGKQTAQALSQLSDGIGDAANDMLPGSPFLKQLNRRPRRKDVVYHILAGDSGFLNLEGRRQFEARLDVLAKNSGVLGRFTRLATGDLTPLLDELTDGTGDGCVALDRTRLDGVADHVTIHANHAELIRAPLLFPDPGPVACMPYVLKWLGTDLGGRRPRP